MSRRISHRRGRMGAVAVAAAALALTSVAAPSAHAGQTYFVPISKSWGVSGHGYGHGHGMSQYGAQGAALKGLGYAAIAKFYYPRTSWDTLKGGVRVLISADSSSDVQVRARKGLTVRDLQDRAAWRLPGGRAKARWRLTPAKNGSTAVEFLDSLGWHRWRVPGGRRTLKGDGQFHAPGPLTLYVPGGGGGVVARKYRGVLRSARPFRGATSRDTVNVLPMDQYVQGVVPNEMPTSWQPQALRAQAVAARTYAGWQRAQNPKRYYQICDTTSCQVYGGTAAEAARSNAAVRATKGRILTYRGRPAFTQFSASSGGWTSAGGQPYLPAKRDRYDGFPANDEHDWGARVSAAALERAHPEVGRLVSLRVAKRDGHGAWGGRVLQIVLNGTQGRARLTGDDFRFFYGLKSTWFTIAPTAIIARWRDLGGPRSGLGRPTSGEHAVRGGSAQNFRHGRIFWSTATGARDLKGPILSAYKKWGSTKSRLGFPATGVMKAPGRGHKARFQGGRMYSSKATGAHVVYGRILKRWLRAGAASGWLGFPTTDVTRIDGGRRARFQHGTVTWDRSSNTVRVKRT